MAPHNERDDGEEMVLFEAPSGRLAQEGSSDDLTRDRRHSDNIRDPLLSSFDDEDMSSVEGGKSFDDRLRTVSVDGIGRDIEEATVNATTEAAQEPSSSSTAQPAAAQPGTLSINAISSNFNFLDRVFKRKPRGTVFGQGSENDGVFNNLSAKPDSQPRADSDKPPTYAEAAADSTPPYWENSILAPGFNDEIFVDGLPVGNIINFVWNLLVSASFQFVGFLLTYILHTSHAAKQGSRAGLGLTFISYAYYMIPTSHTLSTDNASLASAKIEPTDANDYDVTVGNTVQGSTDSFHSSLSPGVDMGDEEQSTTKMLLAAIAVAAFGGVIFIKAFVDYHRARKMEEIILAPPTNVAPEPAQTEDMV